MAPFSGFRRAALDVLPQLPGLDAAGYAERRALLTDGLVVPARALIEDVAAELDAPLTATARGSVSPLHTDLRFAPAGAPRYKDHLLLTAWHGADKKAGPTLWMRIDPTSVGFASGVGFTPEVRGRWRVAVAGDAGVPLAAEIEALRSRHGGHGFEVAGDEVRRVPSPWTDAHPRAALLRKTGFQVRFQVPLPDSAEHAAFVPWCVQHLGELLPVHRWLVSTLCAEDPR